MLIFLFSKCQVHLQNFVRNKTFLFWFGKMFCLLSVKKMKIKGIIIAMSMHPLLLCSNSHCVPQAWNKQIWRRCSGSPFATNKHCLYQQVWKPDIFSRLQPHLSRFSFTREWRRPCCACRCVCETGSRENIDTSNSIRARVHWKGRTPRYLLDFHLC